MRTFIALRVTFVYFAAAFLFAGHVAAQPAFRFLGHGKPSPYQKSRFCYMLNGRRITRPLSKPVVNKNKDR